MPSPYHVTKRSLAFVFCDYLHTSKRFLLTYTLIFGPLLYLCCVYREMEMALDASLLPPLTYCLGKTYFPNEDSVSGNT